MFETDYSTSRIIKASFDHSRNFAIGKFFQEMFEGTAWLSVKHLRPTQTGRDSATPREFPVFKNE
jgi:hypothetical protein